MSVADEIKFRRLIEHMRDVVEASEQCENTLRRCDALPVSEWANFDHALAIAREALNEAELDLYRPAKPRRRDVEDLLVQCDRILTRGEVRP